MIRLSRSLSLPEAAFIDGLILSLSPWGSFYYVMVEVFGIGGGILNATRLPEKWAPGKYDIVGNSHQV